MAKANAEGSCKVTVATRVRAGEPPVSYTRTHKVTDAHARAIEDPGSGIGELHLPDCGLSERCSSSFTALGRSPRMTSMGAAMARRALCDGHALEGARASNGEWLVSYSTFFRCFSFCFDMLHPAVFFCDR